MGEEEDNAGEGLAEAVLLATAIEPLPFDFGRLPRRDLLIELDIIADDAYKYIGRSFAHSVEI
jgi:hypothetical protein